MSHSPQNFYKKLLGNTGEKRVEKYLKKLGCKILKRNYRTPFGEADLIVKDKDEIAFVEVKTRAGDSYGDPKDAVGCPVLLLLEKMVYFSLRTSV